MTELHHVDACECGKEACGVLQQRCVVNRRMDLHIAHVCVTTVLMVGQDGYLNHESTDRSVVNVLERNEDPA